jgi:hypothetical protein
LNKAFVRESDSTEVRCPRCGAIGEEALRSALEALTTAETRRSLAASVLFCPTPVCEVAYFDAFEAFVTVDSLVRPVYPKDPDAPICPCFGLTSDDIQEEAAGSVPVRIRELYRRSKTDEARCYELSPTGRCCLPEVQRLYFKLRGRS